MAARFQKVQKKWASELLIDPNQPHLGSWIAGRWTSDFHFSVMCLPCAQKYGKDSDNPWVVGGLKLVSSLQLGHAKRHQDSFLHQEAVKHLASGSDHLESDKPVRNKPELRTALQLAWDSCRKGSSFAAASSDEIGSREKVGRLTRALGTALKKTDQEVLRKAYTIALHQDTRQGVLCLRYACASLDSSVVHRGVCGFCHNPGTKSEDIEAGVLSILDDLCDGDHELLLHVCDSVELIDSDGASDEQKSLRLLCDIFPHAIFLCRDSTHAARRLTRNPWAADPYLTELMEQYISSSDSICSVIQNSPDLKHVFSVNVSGDCGAEVQHVKNLGLSHDRFDSASKPLGRFVTCFDSVWRTARHISASRRGTEPARKANDFLRHACVESLVQCAMLADAAFESLEVIRFHDTENFDLSSVPKVLANFLHRIDVLFLRKEVVNVGHTKLMLHTLATERTCELHPEGVFKSLGGAGAVQRDILDRCFARMAVWVRLATERIEVEFPSWRALHLFEVFKHPCTNIDQILCRYQAFCGNTTSGVEQTFSKIVRSLGPYRQSMAKDLQNCLFRVVLAPADARDTAVRRGLQLWIDMYGEFRKHAQNTRWKRLRCSVDSAGQETAFHRKRKIEVEQVSDSHQQRKKQELLEHAEEAGLDAWQEVHEKELEKLQNQHWEFMKDAYNQQLLPAELADAQLIAEADEKLARRRQRDDENSKKLGKIARMWDRPVFNLAGASICVLVLNDDSELDQIAEVVAKHKMDLVDEELISKADYLVIHNLDVVPNKFLAIAGLTGKTICNVTYLCSEGVEGAAMAFKPAVASIRHVWLSDAFRQEENDLAKAIDSAMSCPLSKWQRWDEMKFLQKMCSNPKGYKFIGLVSDAEKQDSYVLFTFALPKNDCISKASKLTGASGQQTARGFSKCFTN
ncbi:Uncharacterized protein SCF082_LOCUS43606 [Durusdinium trenchii]|uniref:Uncharacterized protein n=1 Tax=Durusdinium trenchii TaxID=1381693 RepID=A0ABP0QWK2_9DINO